MVNYQEARAKPTNKQLYKLKSAAKKKTKQSKKKTETILKLNKKKFGNEELSHELIARETTKKRNAFANNMSTDIKFSKAQISKKIQSGGSFRSWSANLGKND